MGKPENFSFGSSQKDSACFPLGECGIQYCKGNHDEANGDKEEEPSSLEKEPSNCHINVN